MSFHLKCTALHLHIVTVDYGLTSLVKDVNRSIVVRPSDFVLCPHRRNLQPVSRNKTALGNIPACIRNLPFGLGPLTILRSDFKLSSRNLDNRILAADALIVHRHIVSPGIDNPDVEVPVIIIVIRPGINRGEHNVSYDSFAGIQLSGNQIRLGRPVFNRESVILFNVGGKSDEKIRRFLSAFTGAQVTVYVDDSACTRSFSVSAAAKFEVADSCFFCRRHRR